MNSAKVDALLIVMDVLLLKLSQYLRELFSHGRLRGAIDYSDPIYVMGMKYSFVKRVGVRSLILYTSSRCPSSWN